jgi:AraC family transcriptional regulator
MGSPSRYSALFQKRTFRDTSGLSPLQLRVVLDFTHEHLHISAPLHELALLVNLSPSQFTRLFKRSTGVPPIAITCRLASAKRMICFSPKV